ncbi:hypothetical protein QQF64_005893 [Cirrhinus molitorella]|uniref:Uncharacterized protein n=1 Tax=Cirrhinus molitorella TaxID=172907 RepID=A0ABR3MGP4_9TELE
MVTSLMLPQSHCTRRSYTPAPEGVRRGEGGEERRGEGGQLSQAQRLSPSLTAALCLSLRRSRWLRLSLLLRSQRRCVAVFPSFRCFSLSRALSVMLSPSLSL